MNNDDNDGRKIKGKLIWNMTASYQPLTVSYHQQAHNLRVKHRASLFNTNAFLSSWKLKRVGGRWCTAADLSGP
jgi:hypothetical protein